MADELKQLKADRINEDLKLADRLAETDRKAGERLTALENQFHASQQAPWSLLMSAAGIAITVASMSAGLVYFTVENQVAAVGGKVDTQYERLTADIKRVEDITREHGELAGHPHSVIEKIEALDTRLQTQITDTKDRFDRREQRWSEVLDGMSDKIDDLTKRVHPLYKEGKPY